MARGGGGELRCCPPLSWGPRGWRQSCTSGPGAGCGQSPCRGDGERTFFDGDFLSLPGQLSLPCELETHRSCLRGRRVEESASPAGRRSP